MALDLLEQTLPHIRNSIYRQRLSLPDWKMKEGDVQHGASSTLNDKSWTPIRVPFQWGKYDRTFWFRNTVEVPIAFAGKPLALLLSFPEALLYLNGKPYHGLDVNHQEVSLTSRARAMESFHVAVEAYSGRKKELNPFTTAELVTVDADARRLFNALIVLRDLEKMVEHASQESKDLREIARRTLVYLKYFAPGSEAYPEQIARSYRELLSMLQNEYPTTIPGLIHLIGHSHIDVAWLWRFGETARKCGRTFSTALRLLEEFPDFKYSQSQAVLYQYTRDHYPDLYKQIKQRVLEGRWEVMGSTWVEPDCNIPNGESLVRQIAYGKRFFREEFNIDSNVLWLPDTFGYSWALPQILRKAGVNAFHTSKLTWNDTNKFPHTTFWWEGVDGTRVLSHISPLGLEAQSTPKDLRKSAQALQPGAPVPHVLQTFGFGDGGGGVTKDQIDHTVILRNIVGLPAAQISTVREFFRQVQEQLPPELPVWKNELYLERHRGTLTTHGWIKKANRDAESLLYATELLASLAFLWGNGAAARKYPQQAIEALWKDLLLYQFHDIVPGTSIKDVYAEVRPGFDDLTKRANEIIERSVGTLTAAVKKNAREFRFTLFNPLPWERQEYVEVVVKSPERSFDVSDGNGGILEHQVLSRGKEGVQLLCYLPSVPAYGFAHILVRPVAGHKAAASVWKATPHAFETPLFHVRVDGKGAFSSIHDKTLRRELVQKGKRANLFLTFRDTPKQWEAWDIDADIEKHRLDLFSFKQVRVVEQGPLRLTARLEFRTPNNSVLTQDVHFYHKRRRIDFETHVRWNEKQTLLKVAFPLAIKTSHATYEIQFGAIQRPTKSNDPMEKAKFEVPAQQWADLSEQKYGVSLLNDSKYAYDTHENVLRLTLLRSPHYPHPIEPGHLHDPEITDSGEHRFVYSLLPHAGDWRTGETVCRARELNQPLLIFPERIGRTRSPLLQFNKPGIQVSAVKRADADDAILIRMYEAHGEATDTTLHLPFECKGAAECDLLEQPIKDLRITKGRLSLRFKPFEIKTVRFVPKIRRS